MKPGYLIFAGLLFAAWRAVDTYNFPVAELLNQVVYLCQR